jgi:hypothetical protein
MSPLDIAFWTLAVSFVVITVIAIFNPDPE